MMPEGGTMSFLNRLFGTPEEINGGERCPTYLWRWTIFKWSGHFSIYLHHFVGDDWSLDLHDHPKRFISIGLWGWYIEETPADLASERALLVPMETKARKYQAPWIRTFRAEHIHRLSVPSKNCWTLVIVLKPVREWGFWHLGRFIPWRRYVEGEDGIADKMKACD
jgi:hypothetical protein